MDIVERLERVDCDETHPCLGTWADDAKDEIQRYRSLLEETDENVERYAVEIRRVVSAPERTIYPYVEMSRAILKSIREAVGKR